MDNWDELINALDRYREIRDTRAADLNRPGHYDPCDSQKKHYELDIADATERLDKVFSKMVQSAQYPCSCPHQHYA